MDGIDEVLLFDPLSEAALREIVQLHLETSASVWRERVDVARRDRRGGGEDRGEGREPGVRGAPPRVAPSRASLLKPLARFLLANPDARAVAGRVVEGDIEVWH